MNNTSLIYGLHAATALLETHPELVRCLYLQANRQDERISHLLRLAERAHIPHQQKTRLELTQLVQQAEHQGVVVECKEQPQYSEADLPQLIEKATKPDLILVLDGVQDPHNLGACLRSANAFGVSLVIIPKNNSVGLTPVVRKVACGAAEITPLIVVTNLARTLRFLQEQAYWLIGTAADAKKSLGEMDFKGNVVLVMGGEADGLRHLTQEHCDFLASIPMQGSVSSLNVSVATAVCLYEAQRQRSLA